MLVIRKSRIGLILAVILLAGFLAGCVGGKPNTSANYNASGTVVDSDGVGIEGVLLSFTSTDTNKNFGVAETDEDGKWDKTGLSGSVRVSPAKEGWEFEDAPKIITKEETDLRFVGKQSENMPQTYDASGTVVDRDGVGIAGVVLSFSSADTSEDFGVAETDEDGKWVKDGLSGSVRVSPAKEGWEFEDVPKMITEEETDLEFVGKQLDYMGLELGATWVYETRIVPGIDEDFEEMESEVTQRVIDVEETEDGLTIYTLEVTMLGFEESEFLIYAKDNFGKYYTYVEDEDEGDFMPLFVSPLHEGSELYGLTVIEQETKDTPLGFLDVWVAEGYDGKYEYVVEFAPYIGIILQSEVNTISGDEFHMEILSYTREEN